MAPRAQRLFQVDSCDRYTVSQDWSLDYFCLAALVYAGFEAAAMGDPTPARQPQTNGPIESASGRPTSVRDVNSGRVPHGADHMLVFQANAELARVAKHAALETKTRDENLWAKEREHRHAAEAAYRLAVNDDPQVSLLPSSHDLVRFLGAGDFTYGFLVRNSADPDADQFVVRAFKEQWRIEPDAMNAFSACLKNLRRSDLKYVVRTRSTLKTANLAYGLAYFEGETLPEWTQRQGYFSNSDRWNEDYATVLDVATQILEGLREASQRFVRHLDLIPRNILVSATEDGMRLRLTDFSCLYLKLGGLPLHGLAAISGALPYIAPELTSDCNAASEKADVFTFSRIILFLLSRRFEQEYLPDVLVPLSELEPDLAVLLARCQRSGPDDRPSLEEVAGDLSSIRKDFRERQSTEGDIRESKTFFFFLTHIFGGDLLTLFQMLAEKSRSRNLRKAELGIGLIVPVFLIGLLVNTLFGGHVFNDLKFEVNPRFIPCFMAAMSFTILGFLYFLNICFPWRYYKARVRNTLRSMMCFWYGVPIVVGAYHPNWWPFCCATGMFVVSINNFFVWDYCQGFRHYHPYEFSTLREHKVQLALGYFHNAVVGFVCLVLFGILLGWLRGVPQLGTGFTILELTTAALVLLVNASLSVFATSGDSARQLASFSALEYAIRSK